MTDVATLAAGLSQAVPLVRTLGIRFVEATGTNAEGVVTAEMTVTWTLRRRS